MAEWIQSDCERVTKHDFPLVLCFCKKENRQADSFCLLGKYIMMIIIIIYQLFLFNVGMKSWSVGLSSGGGEGGGRGNSAGRSTLLSQPIRAAVLLQIFISTMSWSCWWDSGVWCYLKTTFLKVIAGLFVFFWSDYKLIISCMTTWASLLAWAKYFIISVSKAVFLSQWDEHPEKTI